MEELEVPAITSYPAIISYLSRKDRNWSCNRCGANKKGGYIDADIAKFLPNFLSDIKGKEDNGEIRYYCGYEFQQREGKYICPYTKAFEMRVKELNVPKQALEAPTKQPPKL